MEVIYNAVSHVLLEWEGAYLVAIFPQLYRGRHP